MEWIKIYDLADDDRHIDMGQRRTLGTEGGLMPDPALLGSPEWWDAIERGDLRDHWLEGRIRQPLWESMGDYPVVEVEDDSGEVTSWTRWGDVTQYSKGRAIRIRWVQQAFKTPLAGLGPHTEVVLEVWFEEGEWRPTAESGPGPGGVLDEGWEGGPA